MNQPDYDAWFRSYAEAYTASLHGPVQTEAIRCYFAETVLALGIDGSLNAASPRDSSFADALEGMYAFARAVGTLRMAVDRVEVSPLHESHDRVQVFYRADYETPDAGELTLPFDLVYLIQRRSSGPAIFAFIAADEMAVLRRHGLVDDQGRPVPRM